MLDVVCSISNSILIGGHVLNQCFWFFVSKPMFSVCEF